MGFRIILFLKRVRKLCSERKIPDAQRKGKLWQIPSDSLKPLDRRKLKGKDIDKQYISLFSKIDSKNEKLKALRENCPLTKTELKALNDNFLVEYTYNIIQMLSKGIHKHSKKQP